MAQLGEKNYSGLRGSLRYNPGERFDMILALDYTREDRANAAEVVTETTPGMAQYLCGKYCTFANFYAPAAGQVSDAYSMPNRTRFDGWGASSTITVGLTDALNLQSISAFRRYNQIWGTDDDYTPDLAEIGQGLNDLSFRFFSQELRLNGTIGEAIDYTLGAFYSDQKSVYFTRQDIRYIAPGFNFQFTGNDPVNADSKAAFGTIIYRPIDNLTLTAGLRYTEESKDYTFVRKNWDGTVSTFLGALDGLTAVYSGDRTDWRLSADYRFSPAVLAYVTVGTGFKGGGVTARPFDAPQALNGSFDPETVTAYEVGLKNDLFDRRLRLNISAFYNDYEDVQLPLISCASLGSNQPCGARQNAGNGKIKGVELELQASPLAGLDIDGSLSYLTGEWSEIDARVGNAILISDPIVSPEWKGSLGIQYKATLGNGSSLTPRIDANYTGETSAGRVAAGGPIDYYDSYTLTNARLTWRNADEDLSIALEAQNVFDEYYQPFRFAAVYGFSGTIYSQVGRPREYAISISKKF